MPASGSPMRIGVGVDCLDGALSTRREARAPRRAASPVLHAPSALVHELRVHFVYIFTRYFGRFLFRNAKFRGERICTLSPNWPRTRTTSISITERLVGARWEITNSSAGQFGNKEQIRKSRAACPRVRQSLANLQVRAISKSTFLDRDHLFICFF